MKNVIISTAVNFVIDEDVIAYRDMSYVARPRLDVEFYEATKVIVGWDRIVLFGKHGQRMAVLNRRDFVGMAIDGKPFVISGDGFAPFTYDEAEAEDKAALDGMMEKMGYYPIENAFSRYCYSTCDGMSKVMGWNTLSEGLAWARENGATQVDYSGIHHPDDEEDACEACNLDQYVEQ